MTGPVLAEFSICEKCLLATEGDIETLHNIFQIIAHGDWYCPFGTVGCGKLKALTPEQDQN